MGKYGGLLADALVLGNHVLLGLLPPVPVVQQDLLALGDDGLAAGHLSSCSCPGPRWRTGACQGAGTRPWSGW